MTLEERIQKLELIVEHLLWRASQNTKDLAAIDYGIIVGETGDRPINARMAEMRKRLEEVS